MRDFLDEFDCRHLDLETRQLISADLVPGLLRKVASSGFDVKVSRGLDRLAQWRCEHGLSISPIFDPRYHPRASERDAVALFLTLGGESIGSVASRLIWCERTLAEELESLRFLYDDPATMAPDGACCTVTARSAHEGIISCWVAHSGGGYMAEEHRGSGCFKLLWRLLQIMLLTEWRWSWETGFMDELLPVGLSVNTYGFRSVEPFIIRKGVDASKRRDYLGCSRRGEVREEVLRAALPDLKSMAEPTAADHRRAKESQSRRGTLRAAE